MLPWNPYGLAWPPAAAFQDIDAGTAGIGLEVQAQGAGRGAGPRRFGAKQEHQSGGSLGRQLQAAQAGETGLSGPGQNRAALVAVQGLFAGPQRFAGSAAAHQQQALQRQPVPVEGGGVGDPGRVDQHQPLAHGADFSQSREQQAEFTQASLAADQFSHRAHRPAAPGQPRIQPAVAAGQRTLVAIGFTPTPQAWRAAEQIVNDSDAAHG